MVEMGDWTRWRQAEKFGHEHDMREAAMSICGKPLGATRCDQPTPCKFHSEPIPSVPRVATSLDDLRVGQEVAWLFTRDGKREWFAVDGIVADDQSEVIWDQADEVVILRDAPTATPERVRVPRELFDRLARDVDEIPLNSTYPALLWSARALVDAVRGDA